MTTYMDMGAALLVFGPGDPEAQRPLTQAERHLLGHVRANQVLSLGVLALASDLGLSYRYTHQLVRRLVNRGLIQVAYGHRRRLIITCISKEGVC